MKSETLSNHSQSKKIAIGTLFTLVFFSVYTLLFSLVNSAHTDVSIMENAMLFLVYSTAWAAAIEFTLFYLSEMPAD